MSQQALDLRKSAQIVRRHRVLVGIVAALGLVAGGAYARLHPPMLTSTALVVLPQSGQAAQSGAAGAANGAPNPYTATQEVIAGSNPVLSGALPDVRPVMSIDELRQEVQIGSLTQYIISVNVKGKVAADIEATANAVARSYIQYIGSPNNPTGQVRGQLLQSAASATGSSPLKLLVIYAMAGALLGALLGALIALAISRGDRRLRGRDEIANSIGVPVIASFPVGHPRDPGGWAKLLEDYKPGALHALQLRKVLRQLRMAASDVDAGSENGSWSFTLLSLSSDPGALALGPQVATFAASQGIPTALVIGPQREATVMATLRTACAAPPISSKRPGYLRVIVSDGDAEAQPEAALTVVVAVVDDRSPRMPDTIRTAATLLGVSAGVATADQLARVAVSAAADDHEIIGLLVADPDSADATTGLLPQLGRQGQRRMPTRLTGMPRGSESGGRR
jgi:capsular polysaccharide biosynthesis protein